MGINSPLRGESIDLIMRASYNRNTVLALDADLALLVVDADVSVRMRSCLDPHLKRGAELLRPA